MADGARDRATEIFTGIWGTGQSWSSIPLAQRQSMVERVHLVEASHQGLHNDSTGILAAGRLEAVTSPVMLVRGERAHPVIAPIFETLAKRLPDTRIEVIAEAGHMAPMTHAPAVQRLIHEHIRDRVE